jgi:hypothetical protein
VHELLLFEASLENLPSTARLLRLGRISLRISEAGKALLGILEVSRGIKILAIWTGSNIDIARYGKIPFLLIFSLRCGGGQHAVDSHSPSLSS